MIENGFEWDALKAATNLKRHKISFREACRVFDDFFAVVEQDLTEDYGEDRFVAIGAIGSLLITVVFTERGNRIRIISARKATGYERRKYDRSQTPS
jgi:uncharacterized protein